MKIILIKADMAIVWLNINVAAICLIIVKLLNHSSELPESHKLKILLFLISSFLIISSDLLTSTEFSSGFEDWEELIILEISSSNSWEEAALLVIVLTTLFIFIVKHNLLLKVKLPNDGLWYLKNCALQQWN